MQDSGREGKIMLEESTEITVIGLDFIQSILLIEEIKVVGIALHINQIIQQGGRAITVLDLWDCR